MQSAIKSHVGFFSKENAAVSLNFKVLIWKYGDEFK